MAISWGPLASLRVTREKGYKTIPPPPDKKSTVAGVLLDCRRASLHIAGGKKKPDPNVISRESIMTVHRDAPPVHPLTQAWDAAIHEDAGWSGQHFVISPTLLQYWPRSFHIAQWLPVRMFYWRPGILAWFQLIYMALINYTVFKLKISRMCICVHCKVTCTIHGRHSE